MITGLTIILILFILIKYLKFEISIQKRILFFLFTLCIPLIYLQFVIVTNNLYTVSIDSQMESKYLDLHVKEGYVGEKQNNSYVIYQDNEDLNISSEDILITKEDKETTFEELKITSSPKIEFNGIINEWLCKDFLLYKPILEKNKELNTTVSKVYVLNLNENLQIKGEE